MSNLTTVVPPAFNRAEEDTALQQVFDESERLSDELAGLPSYTSDHPVRLKEILRQFGALNKRVQALTMRDIWRYDFAGNAVELQDEFGYYTRLPTYLRSGGADENYQIIIQQIIAQLDDNERLNVEVLKTGFVKLTVSTEGIVRDVSPHQFYVTRDTLESYLTIHAEKVELVDGKPHYDATRPSLQQELNTVHPFFIEVERILSSFDGDSELPYDIHATVAVTDLSGEDPKDRRLEIVLPVPDAVQTTFTRDLAIENAKDDQVYQRQRMAWCAEQTLEALHEQFPTRRYTCTSVMCENTLDTYCIEP